MTDEKLILALDASTTHVGWALMHPGRDDFRVLSLGTYSPEDKEGDWVDRLGYIAAWLDRVLREWDEHVEGVVYEVATGNRGNMRTNRLLGAVEYVVVSGARDWCKKVARVTASQTKAKVRQVTARRISVDPDASEHAIDAVAVGLAFYQRRRPWER